MSGQAGKTTSVFLMAIMVAGGLTFAIPGAPPAIAQSTNPNLYVSAESAAFGNHFSGPQVVEVVIIDPDLDETNESKGEPDVTINGSSLRMVQATDGKWYAYFANSAQALLADATADGNAGRGLDFGTICEDTDDADRVLETALEVNAGYYNVNTGYHDANAGYFSDAIAVAFPFAHMRYTVASGGAAGPALSSIWGCGADDVTAAFTAVPPAPPTAAGTHNYAGVSMNVVREPSAINIATYTYNPNYPHNSFGQSIQMGDVEPNAEATAGVWPFIQLFDFSQGGNVEVQYRRGGGIQSVTLNYDTIDDYASLSLLDRTTYPGGGAQVRLGMANTWLNVDPTDKDSWTWDVEGGGVGGVLYGAFDRNGARQGGGADLSGELAGLMCAGNCVPALGRDAGGSHVLSLAGGTSLVLSGTDDAAAADQLVTVTETQDASGIFEGTVIFPPADQSPGHRPGVAKGDTVTARHGEHALPGTHARNDGLKLEGTTISGTLVPLLERAVVSNVRLTDNSGNPLDTVTVGQQIQVVGQVTSGQESEQAYVYLVQVRDSNNITLSLTWTSSTLNPGESLTPSMSWQPTAAGYYTATVFVWESIDNPIALSPQAELPFTVA